MQAFDPTVDADAEPADDVNRLHLRPDPYEAATGARVLVVLTEWDEFRRLDFSRVRSVMAEPHVVDAHDMVAPLDQAITQVRAEEAGAPGDDDPAAHCRPIPA